MENHFLVRVLLGQVDLSEDQPFIRGIPIKEWDNFIKSLENNFFKILKEKKIYVIYDEFFHTLKSHKNLIEKFYLEIVSLSITVVLVSKIQSVFLLNFESFRFIFFFFLFLFYCCTFKRLLVSTFWWIDNFVVLRETSTACVTARRLLPLGAWSTVRCLDWSLGLHLQGFLFLELLQELLWRLHLYLYFLIWLL